MHSETKRTVYYALAANLTIAVAKAVGGLISGSAAMLAEAAHSLADTTNQVFLRISLSRSERESDADHPFGYGKERFFWAFLAAVFIFVAGAVFSIGEGVHRLLESSKSEGGYAIAMVVLVVAAIAEAISLVRALKQTRSQARDSGLPMKRFIPESRDPTAKTVVFEDAAAVAGIFFAMAGVTASHVTGSMVWDGIASIAVGVLLAFVAVALGRDTKGLLIGEAARAEERDALCQVMIEHEGVDEVVELLTMAVGPGELLVAARVDLSDGLESDQIERLATELDERFREAVPDVREVFIDPTPRRGSAERDAPAPARA